MALATPLLLRNVLQEMYQMITLGGDAELELVDSLDPFSGACVRGVLYLALHQSDSTSVLY